MFGQVEIEDGLVIVDDGQVDVVDFIVRTVLHVDRQDDADHLRVELVDHLDDVGVWYQFILYAMDNQDWTPSLAQVNLVVALLFDHPTEKACRLVLDYLGYRLET